MPLEPGPETDLAVAKACGIEVEPIECAWSGQPAIDEMSPEINYKITGSRWLFRPSTDLNDAFLAAEKVGLFDRHICELGRIAGSQWDIAKYEDNSGRHGFYHLAAGKTAALAICAAILKLSETKP